jgi:nucleoside-diphosphate-sugar epimerase
MILLTGASGYLGMCVVEKLKRHNISVKAIRRTLFGKTLGVKSKWCNLSSAKRLKGFMNDVDGIIHMASPRTLKREKVVKEGILGTSYLIDYWKRGNFVYCSSQGVIGMPPKEPFDESLPYNPIYWYDIEKICCELLLLKKKNEEKVSGHYIIFRIPFIFAPNSRMNDYQFLYPIIRHAVRDLPFVFIGKEEDVANAGFSWVDGRDLANTLVNALSFQESGIYNIANGFIRWIDFIEMIKEITGSKSKIIIQEKDRDIKGGFVISSSHSELDISKVTKKGFIPRYTIYQTIGECIDFYLKHYED